MEEHNEKLEALRKHLAEGEAQAMNGDFVKDFSMEKLIAELDQE
jgi:antitoxin ParD1/3/4